jgi:5-formyltetrahydrofolate cyclo-ligase
VSLIKTSANAETGSKVLERLKTLPAYERATNISIFLSMPGGEIQTAGMVRHAFETGKSVFVPFLYKTPKPAEDGPARVMDMVRLQSLKDYESLKNDKWGIPSVDTKTVHERQRLLGGPDAESAQTAALDLVLMPGVAFEVDTDKNIRRLGHGKGFYDLFIRRYRKKLETLGRGNHSVTLCALALNEQLVVAGEGDHIPVGPLDQPLDAIILGSGDIIQGTNDKEG